MAPAASRPGSHAGFRADRACDSSATIEVQWRTMGVLSTAGGLLALASVLLGVDREADERALTVIAFAPIVLGIVLTVFARRIPRVLVVPVLVAALALVSAGIRASGEADAPSALFYIWIAVAAWYFLDSGPAVVFTVATAALSAGVMASVEDRDTDTASWWLVVAGSLLGISTFAGVMHTRSRRLIEQLADAAVRDALTGLLNRRGYQERLAAELARARRYETPLSIVLGDIDAFKALNDRFGHRRGDEALTAFADLLRRDMRDVDFVSRVGGEEFAIVLPDTTLDGAVLVAERLREAIRDELRAPDATPLTASFGVAAFPEHGADAEALLDRADQAMYAAKAAGRDRTVAFAHRLQPDDAHAGAG